MMFLIQDFFESDVWMTFDFICSLSPEPLFTGDSLIAVSVHDKLKEYNAYDGFTFQDYHLQLFSKSLKSKMSNCTRDSIS